MWILIATSTLHGCHCVLRSAERHDPNQSRMERNGKAHAGRVFFCRDLVKTHTRQPSRLRGDPGWNPEHGLGTYSHHIS
ncbi:hypothetical protein BKA63DRAFT_524448 [Paraphoma chrysanthemicola]|nr:hypothetical protein BKA63DRAFT_524448 [Paraphoma chrysanthemicola]